MDVLKTGRKAILAAFGMVLLSGIFLPAWPEPGGSGNAKGFNVGYTVLDFHDGAGKNGKTLTVAVWYPTAAAPGPHNYGGPANGMVAVDAAPDPAAGPYPLLVFSHGYGGSGLSSVFLTEKLAARGWIVAAPDHSDRQSAVRIRTGRNDRLDRKGFLRQAERIGNSDPEHRDEYLYRLDELKLAVDGMVASGKFGRLIDGRRIAVGGHSFGGFTALGVCGTIEDRRDDRVKAVLLFSTGAGGYLFRESELARVKVPSLYIFGEREKKQKRGTKTIEELSERIYGNVAAPKHLLVLKGGNHFSFNNRFVDTLGSRFLGGTEEQFDVIRRYSIAFLERYVAGKTDDSGVLEHRDPLLTRYLRKTSDGATATDRQP